MMQKADEKSNYRHAYDQRNVWSQYPCSINDGQGETIEEAKKILKCAIQLISEER